MFHVNEPVLGMLLAITVPADSADLSPVRSFMVTVAPFLSLQVKVVGDPATKPT